MSQPPDVPMVSVTVGAFTVTVRADSAAGRAVAEIILGVVSGGEPHGLQPADYGRRL